MYSKYSRKVWQTMAEAITTKSVQFDEENDPFIVINGENINGQQAAMKVFDPESSDADKALYSKAMQILGAAINKEAVKVAKVTQAEEAQTKLLASMTEVVEPVTAAIGNVVELAAMKNLSKSDEPVDFVFSLTSGKITIQMQVVDKDSEDLETWSKKLGSKSIGFAIDSESGEYKATSKPPKSGNGRAPGSAVLQDGVYQLADDKEADETDGSFAVQKKKLYFMDTAGAWIYTSGMQFLLDRTKGLGSDEQYSKTADDRPFGFPSEIIKKNSERIAELTEEDSNAIAEVKTYRGGNGAS